MMPKKFNRSVPILLTILFVGSSAWAQEEAAAPTIDDVIRGLDTVWVLVAGALVFFMQAGFGMVESGFTRAKNAANIIMKNFVDFSMAALAFFMFGFAFMFGDGNAFIGFKYFFLFNAEAYDAGVPTYAYWFFQVTFCGTAATIVSGAMAERTKFVAYISFSYLISAIVYPIVGHWTWGGGWLAGMGFLDFAGSTVVHSTGAWAGLVGAMMLGARSGKYNKDGTSNPIPGHNLPLAALGVLILWFGWFGFNPGSTISGFAADDIARIITTTTLAASAGAIGAMFFAWSIYKNPDAGITMNGALAGLVSITAPCDIVSPVGAVLIGLIGGIVVVLGVMFLDKIKIDDPVGAIPVHGFCGAWGTLACGLFAVDGVGLFYGGGFGQLGVQLVGVVAVFIFVTVSMAIIFGLLKATVGLRVSKEDELQGLDYSEHRTRAYPDFQTSHISY